MYAIMLLLVVAVVATSSGMLYWFFRRLNHIESALWGEKQAEAVQTAETEAKDTDNDEEQS